ETVEITLRPLRAVAVGRGRVALSVLRLRIACVRRLRMAVVVVRGAAGVAERIGHSDWPAQRIVLSGRGLTVQVGGNGWGPASVVVLREASLAERIGGCGDQAVVNRVVRESGGGAELVGGDHDISDLVELRRRSDKAVAG